MGARSDARGQHYVPRMLQEAFTTPGKGKKAQLFVFDKHEGRAFRTSPDNVLHERDFNTYESQDARYCLEGGMGKIEALAAPVLRKIIAARSLASLSDEERGALTVFVALQQIRGVSVRAKMVDMVEQVRAHVRQMGQDPDTVPQLLGHDDPEAIKLSALLLAGQDLGQLALAYVDKALLLFSAAPGTRFYLGDTPVVLANHRDTKPYGNLGLEVEGVEIYMPLAPDLLLAFWCPSLVRLMEDGLAACERSLNSTAAAALLGVGPAAEDVRQKREAIAARRRHIAADLAAIAEQRPIESDLDNMDYFNSLQVLHAERYLLSATNEFTFARKILAERPDARQGRRLTIG